MSAPAPSPAPFPPPAFPGYLGTPGGLQAVAFGPRLGARLIDLGVHYVIALISGFIFGVLLGIVAAMKHLSALDLAHQVSGFTAAGFVLALLGSIAYHTLCEGMGGCTIGKQMLGMAVVGEDASPCDLKAATIRSFAYLIDSLFFGLVAYLQMNKTPQQQRHGDHWAKTVVVQRASLPAGGPAATRSPWTGIALGCIADATLIILSLGLKLL
jgi:uncharacterized RDD family membrane protein YckC